MNKKQSEKFYKHELFKVGVFTAIITVIFPLTLVLTIPGYLLYFSFNYKKYPRLGKGSLVGLLLLFGLGVWGTIESQQEENNIVALINDNKFEEALEYIDNSTYTYPELTDELYKLENEYISEEIEELANLQITDIESAVELKTYSKYPSINSHVAKAIIERSDEVKERGEQIKSERLIAEKKATEANITKIQSKIRQINNGRIPILDIPKTIQEFPDTPELSTYRNQLIQAARNHQIKTFPILRKDYAERIGKELWENDYDIYTKGGGNSTIVFVHWSFASNSSIKTTQELFRDKIDELRFDRAEYKWSEYGEYTYYDMKAEADSYIEGVDSD